MQGNLGATVYLLRGFPFLFIFFLLFLVFHELLFPFLILLPVRKQSTLCWKCMLTLKTRKKTYSTAEYSSSLSVL